MTSVEVLGVKDTLTPDKEKYASGLEAAAKTFEESIEIFNAPDFVSKEGWKKEAESPAKDIIYSKRTEHGKLFSLRSEFAKDYETVFNDVWTGLDKASEWNKNLQFSKIVTTLTDNADICHYGNHDMLIVKGRDFVITRMQRKIQNGYMMAATSCQVDDLPETKSHIRGNMVMGSGRIMKKESDPTVTVVDYILCIDLKGSIPKIIVNEFMGKIMINDVVGMREHVTTL